MEYGVAFKHDADITAHEALDGIALFLFLFGIALVLAAAAENKEPAKLPIDEVKPDSNEPSGLYNPETGISWESYLSTRLNNEIDRATASEIDLSLFIIQLSEVQKNSEVFKNVCNIRNIIAYAIFKEKI